MSHELKLEQNVFRRIERVYWFCSCGIVRIFFVIKQEIFGSNYCCNNWKLLFQEIIRTERARELQEQRLAEEAAARAASLKTQS